MNTKNNKNLIYVVFFVVIVVVALYFGISKPKEAVVPTNILSFEDCVKAGLPVMESYPRQCRTPDGRTYTEEIPKETDKITYINSSKDLIIVESPTPGAVTGKDFLVVGEARGYWYFEASFPVTLLDKDGKVLVQTFATAQDEWMTENFVHYRAEVKVPQSYIGPATLVLKKDNPSGLPENDASISFPIVVEY